jgi:hypothetical protein
MKRQKYLQSVVDSLKGRFVSLLLKESEQRKAYSVKVNSATSKNILFTDTNGGNRRVNRRHVLRATCGNKTFKRSIG